MEPEPGLVTWFEHTPRNDVLTASPVDVSTVLGERLFRQVPSVVLTSATLATTVGSSRSPSETPWAYVRKRLGLEDTDLPIDELLVPSPFDFPTRALLYVPRDLPAPGTAEFVDASAARIRTLVAMCDGGAFVLTTSLRSMTHIHARLRQSLSDRPVLLQGASSKQALLDVFRASGRAVLVATMSFWEGVDVPGQTLRLVVLEKVPFPVPTDPIIQARGQALEASGRSAFSELYIPSAALTLKQGFGRLIRTRADYGVVAVLDGRLHSRGYGARILSALPAAAQCDDLDTVQRFWNERAPEHPIPED
jgi:ATP-dependent DNA helicase DinG